MEEGKGRGKGHGASGRRVVVPSGEGDAKGKDGVRSAR